MNSIRMNSPICWFSSQVYLIDHSFSHSDPHQIDFMMIISIDIDCYKVVFENLSIQWMKIVDWRLIRVLMIEVNIITYEVWGPPQCTQGLRSLCIYERIGEFEYHGLIMNEILILWIDSFDRKGNILRAVDNHNDSVIF